MRDRAMNRLHDLLAQEREAILSGRYQALAAIGLAKEDVVRAAFSTRRPGQEGGLALLRHNQTLLAAALGGLRGAAGLPGRAAAFMSYGRDGQRAAIGPDHPGFERRA